MDSKRIKDESDMKILLLGSTGLLGSSLYPFLCSRGYNIYTHSLNGKSQNRVDLTCKKDTAIFLEKIQPDVIVNLVALTNVDFCEENPKQAFLINTHTVDNIVNWIKSRNSHCHLVQLSTDQVYDGAGPHTEEDVLPMNYYSLTKIAGEYIALTVPSTILRINFFGKSSCKGRTSLSDWIISSLRSGEKISVFSDIKFSGLHIQTLCAGIELAIQKRHNGIFNLGSRNGVSKAYFAQALSERLGLKSSLMTICSSKDIKFHASRPVDMRMDSSFFERTFNFIAPTFESQIDLTAQEYLYEQTSA